MLFYGQIQVLAFLCTGTLCTRKHLVFPGAQNCEVSQRGGVGRGRASAGSSLRGAKSFCSGRIAGFCGAGRVEGARTVGRGSGRAPAAQRRDVHSSSAGSAMRCDLALRGA